MKTRRDPFDRSLDERLSTGGDIDPGVEMVGEHLLRGVAVGPKVWRRVELEGLGAMLDGLELLEHVHDFGSLCSGLS